MSIKQHIQALKMVSENPIVKIESKLLSIDPITRRDFYDPDARSKLHKSMKKGFEDEHPLVIRPDKEKRGHWLITCGQHRFEEGTKLGIMEYPCIIKEQSDKDAIVGASEDNTINAPLDAISQAKLFERLGNIILAERVKKGHHPLKGVNTLERKYPVSKIAEYFGIENTDFVDHRLRLLELPEKVQWMIARNSQISQTGHKISPTIGYELYRIQTNLEMQKEGNIEEKILELAVKINKDWIHSQEVRTIRNEIGQLGYEKWKDKQAGIVNKIENGKIITCAICGKEVNGESPWLPFCLEHKYMITSNSLRGKIPSRVLNDLKGKDPNYIYSKGKKPVKTSIFEDSDILTKNPKNAKNGLLDFLCNSQFCEDCPHTETREYCTICKQYKTLIKVRLAFPKK